MRLDLGEKVRLPKVTSLMNNLEHSLVGNLSGSLSNKLRISLRVILWFELRDSSSVALHNVLMGPL